MTLHVKESGNWEQVNEVYIKHRSLWERVKEVYVKEDGQWKPTLYEAVTQTITTPGTGTIEVPHGAFRATVTITGGNGGNGGRDGGQSPGIGGKGAEITVVFDVDPFTTLSYNIASDGNNGVSGGGSTGATGGTGYANGGQGGDTGPYGWSGTGGGGGGASSLAIGGTTIVVAGGGSGAGGRGNQVHISQSQINGKNSTQITNDPTREAPNNGGPGEDCPYPDGGGGGGGGAGVGSLDLNTFAPGGLCFDHYDSDCYPGKAGVSYYNASMTGFDYDIGLNSGTDGRLSITWLRDKL